MSSTSASIADVRARLQNVLLAIDNTLYSGGLSTHRYDDTDPNDSALGTTPRSSIRGEEDVSYYTPLAGRGAVRTAAPTSNSSTTTGLVGRLGQAPLPRPAVPPTAAPVGRSTGSLTRSAPAVEQFHDETTSPSKRVTFSVPPPLRHAPPARKSTELHPTSPPTVAPPLTVEHLAQREGAQRLQKHAVPAPALIPTTSIPEAKEPVEEQKASAAAAPKVESVSALPEPHRDAPSLFSAPAAAPVALPQKIETPPPALPSPSFSERASLLNEDTILSLKPKSSSSAWRPTVPMQEPETASALRRPVPTPEAEEGNNYSGTLRYTDPNRFELHVDKHLKYNDGNDTIDAAFQSLEHHFATSHHVGCRPSREEDGDKLRRQQPQQQQQQQHTAATAAPPTMDRSCDFVKSPPRVTHISSQSRAAAVQREMEEAEHMLAVLRQRRAYDEAQLRESRQVPVTRRPAPSPPRTFSANALPAGGRSSDYALTTLGNHRSVSPHTAHDDLDLSQLHSGGANGSTTAAATGDAERTMRRRLAQQHEQEALRRSETSRSRAAAEEELQSLYREAQAMRDRQDRLRESGLLTRGEALQREVAAECAVRPPSPAELTSIREHAYELARLRALYEGRVERSTLPDATVLECHHHHPPTPVAEDRLEPLLPSNGSLDIPQPEPAIVQRRTRILPAAVERKNTPERARPLKRKVRKPLPQPQPQPPSSDEEEEAESEEEAEEEDEENTSENESLSDSTVGEAPRADEHTHLPPQPTTGRPAPAPPSVVKEPPSPSPRGAPAVVPLLPTDVNARGYTPNSIASSVRSERLHVSPTRHGRFTVDGSRDRDRSYDDDDDGDNSEVIGVDGDDYYDGGGNGGFAARARKNGTAKNLYGRPSSSSSSRPRGTTSSTKRPFPLTRSRADPERVANHEALQAAMAEVTMMQAVNKLKQKGVAVDVKLAGRRIPARLTLSADETELLFEVDRLVPKPQPAHAPAPAAPPRPQPQKQMQPRPQAVSPRQMMPPQMAMGVQRPGPYPSPQRMARAPPELIRTKGLPPGVRPIPLPAGITPLLQHNIPIVHDNQVSWLNSQDPRMSRTLPYGPSVTRTNSPATTHPPSSAASSRRSSVGPSARPAVAAAAKVETVQVRESHHFPVRNARAYMPFAVMGNEWELGDGGPHTWEDVGGVLCGPAACELLRCYRCTLFAEMRAPAYCNYRVFVLVPETQRAARPKEAVLLVLDFRSRVDLITFLLGFQQVKGGRPLTYGRVLWLLATQRLQRARSFLGLNPFDMECILRGVPVPLGGRSPAASRPQSPAASREASAILGYRPSSPLTKARNKLKNLFTPRRRGDSASPNRRERAATAPPPRKAPPPRPRGGREQEEVEEEEAAKEEERDEVQHAYEEKPHKSSRFGILRRFTRSISGSRSRKDQSSRLEEVNANTSTSKKKTDSRFVLPD